jgi:tetratricopeptide (TPR) repeat protein
MNSKNLSQKSAESVREVVDWEQELHHLKPNNRDSFFIIPVYTQWHLFASLIRSENSQDYSVMLINKGERAGEKIFKEYIVEKNNILETLRGLSLYHPSVKDAYRFLEKVSKSSYGLNVKAGNQKVGNCFIKEPELAIRYAYASRNLNDKDVEDLRAGKLFFRPKWNYSLLDLRESLAVEIIKKYPKTEKAILENLKRYKENKIFRKYLDESLGESRSLFWAFDKSNKMDSVTEEEKIKELLKNVNLNTLTKYSGELVNLAQKTADEEMVKTLKDMKYYSSLNKIYTYYYDFHERVADYFICLGRKKSFYENIEDTFKKGEKHFPILTRQMKLDYHLGFFLSATINRENGNLDRAIERFTRSINLYPHNADVYAGRGFSYEIQKDYKKAIDDYKKALALKPDDERVDSKLFFLYARLIAGGLDKKLGIEIDPEIRKKTEGIYFGRRSYEQKVNVEQGNPKKRKQDINL